MPAILTVREAGTERRIVFAARAVVGRDADCDVVLSSRSVSRKHAILEKKGEAWVVRDLGSANGLYVEGKRVSEAPVPSGTSLRFGDVEASFDAGAPARTTSAERLAQSLSIPPARKTRPVAVFIVMTFGVAALVAATIWTRSCDHAARAAARSAAVSAG
ncbi:MAG TPA: FHA domain-containing protein [Thermoanaerobaculia bacterium]|nr:FHA domain-containing protein [Thermoanaerobaculia bacterium]